MVSPVLEGFPGVGNPADLNLSSSVGSHSIWERHRRVQHPFVLAVAQVLEAHLGNVAQGNAQDPKLQAIHSLIAEIQRRPAATLPQAFSGLSEAEQRTLSQFYGSRLGEFFALASETDAEMLGFQLLNLGQRAMNDRDSLLAGVLFETLSHAASPGTFSISEELRTQARAEAATLRGEGSFGRRFELGSRNFVSEVTQPSMLIGMGVASTVFSSVRLGILSRMAAQPAGLLTRGWLAGSVASTLAFPAEVLSFWGTSRACGMLTSPDSLRWDGETIRHELLGLGLSLGLLKLGGALSQGGFDRFHGFDPLTGEAARLSAFTRISRPLFQQAGMFGGITLGHLAEQNLGWRPRTSTDALLTDSLITLAQFEIGGRLSQSLMGRGHARLMHEMALRTQAIELPPPGGASFKAPNILASIRDFLRPQEVGMTPDGIPMSIPEPRPLLEAKDLIAMAVKNDDNGASPASGNIRSSASLIPVTRDMTASIETIIRSYRRDDLHLSDRSKFAAELFEHIDIVDSVLDRMIASDELHVTNPKARLTSRDKESFMHNVRKYHFETVSDQLFTWIGDDEVPGKFRFLANELTNRIELGNREEREVIENLRRSVQQKQREANRYYREAESFPGDDKGPFVQKDDGPAKLNTKSAFHPNNYPRILARFTGILQRLDQYIANKPLLAKLLQGYTGEAIPRHYAPVPREVIEGQIAAVNLPAELAVTLRYAVKFDPLLTHEHYIPLNRLLNLFTNELTPEYYLEVYQPLHDYLKEFSNLLRRISPDDLKAMSSDPWDYLRGDHNELAQKILVALRRVDPHANESMIAPFAKRAARLREWLSFEVQNKMNSDPPGNPLTADMRESAFYRETTELFKVDPRGYEEYVAPYLQELANLLGRLNPEEVDALDANPRDYLYVDLGFDKELLTLLRNNDSHVSEETLAPYLNALTRFGKQLSSFAPRHRYIASHPWSEIRGQVYDLIDRGFLSRETVDGLMAWFDPPNPREANTTLISIRNDALEGMLDFFLKGSHTPEMQSKLFGFLDQVVRNRDERMLEVLAFTFQDYALGTMNTRMDMRSNPSADPLTQEMSVEWHDRFLEAMLSTTDFYGRHNGRGNRQVVGPFLELFEKLSRYRKLVASSPDPASERYRKQVYAEDLGISRLTHSLLQRTADFLEDGYSVDLTNRGGVGEGVMHLRDPRTGGDKTVGVTSIDAPLLSRGHLEHWLGRIEGELIMSGEGDKARSIASEENPPESKSNGGRPGEEANLDLHVQIARLAPGINKREIGTWARDYLENHPQLANIYLYIPDKGNEATDPFNPNQYRKVSVSRNDRIPTIALIENLERDILANPEALAPRLELYRVRQSMEATPDLRKANWTLLRETARMFPRTPTVLAELNRSLMGRYLEILGRDPQMPLKRKTLPPDIMLSGTSGRRLEIATDFLNTAFGVDFAPETWRNPFDLGSIGWSLGDVKFNYRTEEGVTLLGTLMPPPNGPHTEVHAPDSYRVMDAREFHEPDDGIFAVRIRRDPKKGEAEAFMQVLNLPPKLRGYGAGTLFFHEVVKFARTLGARKIYGPDLSNENRYAFALWGMDYLREMDRRFFLRDLRNFVDNHVERYNLWNYDLRAIHGIPDTRFLPSPLQIAQMHMDPQKQTLVFGPYTPDVKPGQVHPQLPPNLALGRIFLLSDAHDWSGVFDANPESESSQIFYHYFRRRFPDHPDVRGKDPGIP